MRVRQSKKETRKGVPPAGATVWAGTSIGIQYSSQGGLFIGFSGHGVSLPTPHWYQFANLQSLSFNGNQITDVRGQAGALGVSFQAGLDKVKETLNNRQDVISGLKKLAAFFGKCAGKK